MPVAVTENDDAHETQRHRQAEHLGDLRSKRDLLVVEGASGFVLFEKMAGLAIAHRKLSNSNRCQTCWHDVSTHCICDGIAALDGDAIPPVKFLILMHYKEYLSAGNTAKILLAMLPDSCVELFVFGRDGDFDRLVEETLTHPQHTLILWPGKGSLTIGEFLNGIPDWSRSASTTGAGNPDGCGDQLHVVVLDGTYSNAKTMHKTMKKCLGENVPPHVALHTSKLSVFHRAQKKYGSEMARGLKRGALLDPDALRISTAEACALLLVELGGHKEVQDAIVAGVITNNKALVHEVNVELVKDVPGNEGDFRKLKKTMH